MSNVIVCPGCEKGYRVKAEVARRKMRCPACGSEWIPEVEAAKTASAVPKARPVDDGPLLPPMPRAKHDEDLIDMTAMVDIVFFLLIFFLVTTAQPLESVMNMPTPESSTGAITPKTPTDYQNDPNCVMIRIEDDDSIWIDDNQVFGDDEMRTKLRDIRHENSAINSAMIVGNADASHGAAVRVFDACMAAGIDKPNFSVEESE